MTNSNSSNSPYILEMRNVSKTFPGVKALDQSPGQAWKCSCSDGGKWSW